jgi:hypothetical protein
MILDIAIGACIGSVVSYYIIDGIDFLISKKKNKK